MGVIFRHTLVEAGDLLTVFGVPVTLVKYSTTLLPALLISVFAYYCEKFLTKIIPGIIRTVLVGMLTMGISYVVGITVLAPLGDLIGNYVVHIFLWSSATFGPVAIGLLAAAMPWLVMTGMHHAVTPFMVQAFANPGYDVFFRPAYILHNMAEGGACIGVALRSKNKAFKAECFSLAVGCIVAGVTEPALYGVNLKLKKPMIGVMAGAAAGGVVAGIMGATAYVYGYSTILAIPIFQDTMLAIVVAIAVAIIGAAVVTFFLGFEDTEHENTVEDINTVDNEKNVEEVKITEENIYAIAKSQMIPLEKVNDEVFSKKIMGDGVAFQLKEDYIYAPAAGELATVFPTGHAFGIQTKSGVEILVHIGIDTVKLDGKGFTILANQGEKVVPGQALIKVDRKLVTEAGYDLSTMLIITESNNRKIDFSEFKNYDREESIGKIS